MFLPGPKDTEHASHMKAKETLQKKQLAHHLQARSGVHMQVHGLTYHIYTICFVYVACGFGMY